METSNALTLFGVVLSILAHAFATIWWASKVSTTLSNILLALVKIDAEFEKRDKQISRIWERIDSHTQKLTIHETILNGKKGD